MSQVANEFKGASAYDIIAWHRPIASGIVVGSIVVVWSLFVGFEYTIATFVCRIVQVLFVLGAASTVTQRAFVSAADFTASMDRAYEKIRPITQREVQRAFELLTWRNFNASAKAFVASFLVAYVGNWVSDSILFLVVIAVVFTVPVVYEKKKPQIDAQLRKVQSLSDKYLSIIKTKGAAAKSKIEEAKQEADTEFAQRKQQ